MLIITKYKHNCLYFADGEAGLHIERIRKDDPIWDVCVSKVDVFTRTFTLPELLGKWYTNSNRKTGGDTVPGPSNTTKKAAAASDCEQKFCYCGGPEGGTMVVCE